MAPPTNLSPSNTQPTTSIGMRGLTMSGARQISCFVLIISLVISSTLKMHFEQRLPVTGAGATPHGPLNRTSVGVSHEYNNSDQQEYTKDHHVLFHISSANCCWKVTFYEGLPPTFLVRGRPHPGIPGIGYPDCILNHNTSRQPSPFPSPHLTSHQHNAIKQQNPLTMSAPESSKTHPAPTVIRDEIQTSADSPASPPSDMPPPAHVIVFSPPPPATFTVKQILDYPLLTPSPPSGASVNIAASKATRPTHNSSARALLHQPIHPHSLSAISAFNISAFRHRLKSMESIRFNDPMSLVWEASPMLSEGCVTGYLDAQVLGAAWQAVLQMVPKDRDYDLEMVKQVPAMASLSSSCL